MSFQACLPTWRGMVRSLLQFFGWRDDKTFMVEFRQILNAFFFVLALTAPWATLAREPDTFLESLRKSYAVLSNPELTAEIKHQEVDSLFKQAGVLCADNCDLTLQKLRWLNDQVHAGTAGEIFDAVPIEWRERAGIKPENLHDLAQSLDKLVKMADPVKLRRQTEIAIEVLRYVVSLEERNLFALSSKDPAAQTAAMEQLKKDIATFHKQGRAMLDLMEILKNINGNDAVKNKELSVRLAKDLDDLGLFFLKFAQSLSNANVLPPAVQDGLRGYQDDNTAMSAEKVEKLMMEEFGRNWRAKFVDFDAANPLKVGTVAQTYRAKVKTLFGIKMVIVKVQKPGLAEQLDWNRRINKIVTKSAEAAVPEKWAWAIDLFAGSIQGLEDAFEGELDFIAEAANMNEFRRQFAMSPSVRVPKAYTDFSTKRVLTQEAIEGENIERFLDRSDAANGGRPDVELRKKLFSNLFDAFSYQLVTVGDMHADLHPGNILATEDGEIGLIDWGQTFKSRGMVSEPVKAMFALLTGDSNAFVTHFLAMGRMPEARIGEFRAYSERLFREKKLSLWNFRKLMGSSREDYAKAFLGALKEVVPKAFMEFGFKASPQYLQFFRSAAPVAASLARIGAGVPQDQLIEIVKSKTLAFAPDSITRRIGAKALGAVDWASAPIVDCAKSAMHWLLPQLR